MKIKKILCGSLIVVFITFIISSVVLVSKKPDFSKIPKAQQIAEYTKPAVVRIVNGAFVKWKYIPDYNSYFYPIDSVIMEYLKSIDYVTDDIRAGSGATISSNGYIVTNAHVVELSKLDDKEIIKNQVVDLTVQVCKYFQSKYNVNFSPEAMLNYLVNHLQAQSVNKVTKVILPGSTDLIDGEIKSYGAPIGEGKDVAVIKIEKTNLPSIMLGDSEKTQLQENIWVFGYPAAADSALLSKESILVVSITDGKISATDKKSAQGAPVLQINAAATHGNSGGPVIDEQGNIIGLLTFRSENNSQETQGFNFVVPVNTVKEFVNQAGAKNEEGDANKLYREGLQLYWAGYYKDALTKFESVQRLNSTHSEIKKLISDCQQKSSQSKILWSKYKNVAMGVDAVALIGIILLVYFGFIRRKNSELVLAEIPSNAMQNNNTINSSNENLIKDKKNSSSKQTISEIKEDVSQIQSDDSSMEIRAKLYAVAGPLEGNEVSVTNEPVIIGRDPRVCNLVFPQDCIKIARKHCIINYDSEKQMFVLEDTLSTQGTFLSNGKRINPLEKQYLKSGDSFYLSSTDYMFEVWIE